MLRCENPFPLPDKIRRRCHHHRYFTFGHFTITQDHRGQSLQFLNYLRNRSEPNYQNPREREPLPAKVEKSSFASGRDLHRSEVCHSFRFTMSYHYRRARSRQVSSLRFQLPPLDIPSSLSLAALIPARPWARQCTSSLLVVYLPSPIDPVVRKGKRGGSCQKKSTFPTDQRTQPE